MSFIRDARACYNSAEVSSMAMLVTDPVLEKEIIVSHMEGSQKWVIYPHI